MFLEIKTDEDNSIIKSLLIWNSSHYNGVKLYFIKLLAIYYKKDDEIVKWTENIYENDYPTNLDDCINSFIFDSYFNNETIVKINKLFKELKKTNKIQLKKTVKNKILVQNTFYHIVKLFEEAAKSMNTNIVIKIIHKHINKYEFGYIYKENFYQINKELPYYDYYGIISNYGNLSFYESRDEYKRLSKYKIEKYKTNEIIVNTKDIEDINFIHYDNKREKTKNINSQLKADKKFDESLKPELTSNKKRCHIKRRKQRRSLTPVGKNFGNHRHTKCSYCWPNLEKRLEIKFENQNYIKEELKNIDYFII